MNGLGTRLQCLRLSTSNQIVLKYAYQKLMGTLLASWYHSLVPALVHKSSLSTSLSTVCACANNSGNFPRTSPNTDKLHLVVMRRNNQTRYTACSVAAVSEIIYLTLGILSLAVFTRRSVVSILLILASYPGHVSCQILLGNQQLLVSYSAAVTDYSSADSSALRLAT